MIDMLGIGSDLLIDQNKITQIKKDLGVYSQGILDTQYAFAHTFKHGGEHCFTLKWLPKLNNLKQTILLINPSRFSSFSHLDFTVRSIIDSDLTISRVDLCSDLPVDISEIETRLRVKYKKRSGEFLDGRNLTGLSFGTRNDVCIIYNKAFQLKKERVSLQGKAIKINTKDACTRFEIRKKGSKVPYRDYSDLEKYVGYNPFTSIQLYDFHHPENQREIHRSKAIWAKEQCEKIGFNKFYKLYNDSNNFTKSWLKHFQQSNLNQDLLNNYQLNLSTFMRG
jgi:hypothetical protein